MTDASLSPFASSARLLVALAAGPTLWIAQLILDYALASQACFPGDAPMLSSPPPGWPHERSVLAAVNIVCLALCLAGLAGARALRTRIRRGDREGEARDGFLARCALIGNAVFAVAVAFDTIVVLGLPTCWRIAG